MKDSAAKTHPLAKWIERHSTPVDFAREIRCSRSHLNNIIAGRKQPSFSLLNRIIKKTNGKVGVAAFRIMEAAE